MTETTIPYQQIGVIRTEFTSANEPPGQAAATDDTRGRVELFEDYAAGLADLDGFSHIILVYHLRGISKNPPLTQTPRAADSERGVFATRSPRRPNPIGIAVVGLDSVEGAVLSISGVDMLDGTPLLDIKPFVPAIDTHEAPRIGWLEDL